MGGEALAGNVAVNAGYAMFVAHRVPGVPGVLHPGMTDDVVVQDVSSRSPSMPTSIADGRGFLRFDHLDLLP
jgi:hypothetical protein